jgi:hypothetical protein
LAHWCPVPSTGLTHDEVQTAVLAFLDQFIGRGAAEDVRDLRARLVADDTERARLIAELPDGDVAEREAYDAMRRFLAVGYQHEPHVAAPDGPDLAELLSWTGWDRWGDGKTTNDPAQWHDWIGAVRIATA